MRIALLSLFFVNIFWANNISADEAAAIPTYTIEIASPAAEETFQNDAQSITVTLSVKPDLAPEDNIIMLVDGNPATEPQHSAIIALPYLERGSHTLQAKIIQPNGKGAESTVITIYQQRTSTLLKPKH